MNQDIIQGKWQQMKGEVKKQWGKLTDNDLTTINGSAQKLSGRIQEIYGIKREEAEKQIDTFLKKNRYDTTH